jgi:type IV secretion system protein TrbL
MERTLDAKAPSNQRKILVALLMIALPFIAGDVFAAADLHNPEGSFDGLLDLIKQGSESWTDKLKGYATRVFWLLASIQFVWTFFPLVFRQADFGEIIGELVRFIMTIGFFYALLLFATDWASAIVSSFRQAGAEAAGLGTPELKPGDMFGLAIDLADMVGSTETWNPLAAVMIALAAVVVLLCFAFIAAFMGLTLVESYVVINASVLFMGLGASQWTREYAVTVMRYAVSVGAKLFIVTLLIGLVMDSAKQWKVAYTYDDASMWTMVGLAIVCAYLTKTIPELIAGMINGSSMGGGAQIGSMAAAAAAGAAAAIATIATAGAAGAASGETSAVGNGGLAGAINASLAGGQNGGPSTATGATSMTSGSGNLASSASPRIGGGATTHPSSGSVPSNNAQKSAGGNSSQSSTKQESGAKSEGKKSAQTGNQATHTVASGLMRSAGILSAISVPGMESASGISLGAAPPPSPTDTNEPSMEVQGADNIIRPATVSEVPESALAATTEPAMPPTQKELHE